MTTRIASLICLACGLVLGGVRPLAANTPAGGMTDTDLTLALVRAVERGVFLVVDDPGVSLAIIGRAPEGLGVGALRRLDVVRGRSDLIVAAQALSADHPASLDTLPRRALRIATHDGYCAARLGRVFVVDIASRGTLNVHRDAPMRATEEASEVWQGGGYVAAEILRGCPGGILATTRVSGTPARATSREPTPVERSRAELAFAGSHAGREASMFRVTGQDGGGSIGALVFAFDGSHTISIVHELLPDIWHCSGAQTVFPMLLEERGGETRSVRMPRMNFAISPRSVVVDIDGDGVIELVFEDEGSVDLFELRPSVSALTRLGGFGVSYEIGC